MSRTKQIDANKPEPVSLPNWPSCYDCIVSSGEDLAVACGEIVHILTPRSQATSRDPGPHSQWQTYSFRVNQFYEHEWPYQQLTTTADLSLGEEQSESVVCSLAWSSAGLGIHNRSVLGIITSNLVLSFWETDGSLGQYKRTCIVNHSLDGAGQSVPGHACHRPAQRIRSFSWSPVLLADHSTKNGAHHIVIANDEDKIFVLHVSKKVSSSYGGWSIINKLQIDLKAKDLTFIDSNHMSPLELAMLTNARILRIAQHEWVQKSRSTAAKESYTFTSRIELEKGQQIHSFTIVASNIDNDENLNSSELFQIRMEGHVDTHSTKTDTMRDQTESENQPTTTTTTKLEDMFATALQTVRKAFSEEHKLFGNNRARFWGVTRISKAMGYAACITLHPSDMIEHTTPALERSLVIFTRLYRNQQQKDQPERSDVEIIASIIRFSAINALKSYLIDQSLDFEILRAQYMLASIVNSSATDQETLRTAIIDTSPRCQTYTSQPVVYNTNYQTSIANVRSKMIIIPNPDEFEVCNICGATIPFSQDLTSTTCQKGHQFSRCRLSFVAIQEPGVSKYCSGCGKQFLDLGKLGLQSGPSFARLLFEEFDVCPYCGAKFRG